MRNMSPAKRAFAITALAAFASSAARAETNAPSTGSVPAKDKAPFADEARKVDAAAEKVEGELKQAGKIAKDAAGKALIETEIAVNDALDKKSEVVDFDKGSASLSNGEVRDLTALFASLDAPSRTGKIYVAGWSDQELPVDGRKTLGNDAITLANDRIAKVRDALKQLGVKGEVVPVNLAKSPNTLQELFGTKSAKVANKTLHGAKINDANLDEAGKVIQERGGPSKVVVYVQQ